MLISRPARLLECLEFDPEAEAARRTAGDGNANVDRVMQLKLLAKDDHMPQYILSRLQTNFGVTSVNNTQVITTALSASASHVNFVSPDYKPTKRDFKFEKQLSAGAYGAVYLAKHNSSGEYVAIKVLRKKDLRTKNMIDQVMNERDILHFAQNPFLVTLYCSFASKVKKSRFWLFDLDFVIVRSCDNVV